MFSCDTVIAPCLRETLAFLGPGQESASIDAAITVAK